MLKALLHSKFELMVNNFLIFNLNSTFIFSTIDSIFKTNSNEMKIALDLTFVVSFGYSLLR